MKFKDFMTPSEVIVEKTKTSGGNGYIESFEMSKMGEGA